MKSFLSVCEKEPFVWRFFLKEGIYTAEHAVKVTKLDWDRLQNSVVDLKNFQELIGLNYDNSSSQLQVLHVGYESSLGQ